MATIPDRLRLSTDRPKTDELTLAVNSALREISAAFRQIKIVDVDIPSIVAQVVAQVSRSRGVSESDVRRIAESVVAEAGKAILGADALRQLKLVPAHSLRYLSYLITPGDGMGGSFVFDATSTAPESNDYIRPASVSETSPGRWVRTVNS